MTCQEYRHIAIAIDRKFIRGIVEEADEDEEEDDVHDLMAAHSTKLATARYARMGGLTRSLTSESIDVFRSISDKWQQWYGIVSRKRDEVRNVRSNQEEEGTLRDRVDAAVKDLWGPTGTFRNPQQEEGVRRVVDGESPLFVILPTGVGKSAMFLIPAMLKDAKTTVVITPLVALAEDMLRHCKDANIDCIIYGHVQPRMARIIIVVTESAVNSNFVQYILDIHLKGRLDRIVFDEIHKLVKDINFRPKLEQLNQLSLSIQYVFLTATFPPTLMSTFHKQMLIKDPIFVRQVNHKPLVRYEVRRLSGDVKRETYNIIDTLVKQCQELEKVLIFCKSRTECKDWSLRFECGAYYSDSSNKAQTLEDWMTGAFFATGSLGAGVDITGLKWVIHIGCPYGMINFDQEVGRGGRAGEVVTSMILISNNDYIELLSDNPTSLPPDEAAMREFIVGMGCRRMRLSIYMNGDGEEVNCEMLAGEVCDICLSSRSLYGNELVKRRREMDEVEVREIKKRR